MTEPDEPREWLTPVWLTTGQIGILSQALDELQDAYDEYHFPRGKAQLDRLRATLRDASRETK